MELSIAKLIKRTDITSDIFELYFEMVSPETRFNFKGGQFLSLIIPKAGPGGRDLRRAYSISSAPDAQGFELCIKLVEGGFGSTHLSRVKEGGTIQFYAPYGDFIYKTPAGKNVLMIATGTGITPFKSIVESKNFSVLNPKSLTVLYGARTPPEMLYYQPFKKILGPKGYICVLSRADEKAIESTASDTGCRILGGRVTDYLRNHGDEIDWANTDFYLCGNGAMIEEVKGILHEKGVQKPSIFQEVYYKTKPGQKHA